VISAAVSVKRAVLCVSAYARFRVVSVSEQKFTFFSLWQSNKSIHNSVIRQRTTSRRVRCESICFTITAEYLDSNRNYFRTKRAAVDVVAVALRNHVLDYEA